MDNTSFVDDFGPNMDDERDGTALFGADYDDVPMLDLDVYD